jgi:4-aminobutyrate aminotransferase-like enzyme
MADGTEKTAEATQILALNRFDPASAQGLSPRLRSLVGRRMAAFGAASVLAYEQPIEMVRAEGVWMYDSSGRRYLDVYNNVPSVGHCHPRVVEAIARQAATLNTHTRYLYESLHLFAERLLATFPAGLSNVVLTCTGSESNDLALRLARTWTGRGGFIVTETAYHGNTAAVTEVSPSSFKSQQVPAHVRTVPAPDLEPGAAGDGSERFAAQIRSAIDDLERSGIGFAALLVDSIFSSDGIYADPPGFLVPAVAAVHAAGGLFISDEVQPGFGRTGTMWGFDRHGVVPDIVTLGKPMGNGFPIGGVVTRPDILTRFCAETGYFNTFGGNPVAAAAGLAVLDVLRDEGLMENAVDAGDYLRRGLREMSNRFPPIAAVRGAGLFTGVEFRTPGSRTPDPATATHVINALKERGVLIGAAGSFGNTLKIRPPLCFSCVHADIFLEAMEAVLAGLDDQPAATSKPPSESGRI